MRLSILYGMLWFSSSWAIPAGSVDRSATWWVTGASMRGATYWQVSHTTSPNLQAEVISALRYEQLCLESGPHQHFVRELRSPPLAQPPGPAICGWLILVQCADLPGRLQQQLEIAQSEQDVSPFCKESDMTYSWKRQIGLFLRQ